MADNVYLFVPNIIGYARVILAFASFYFMPISPYTSGFLYLMSGLLDAFDGHAARALNQGMDGGGRFLLPLVIMASKYGAVLDMLTDRCATTCLLMVLALFYPKWMVAFQFLVSLDITSHWAQMYSSMMKGKLSHKSVEETGNPFLRLYYTSRVVLFVMCAGNEIFFAMLYILYFENGPIINILITRISLWKLLAVVSFPISFLKNLINVVQMVGAFKTIAASDIEERSKQK